MTDSQLAEKVELLVDTSRQMGEGLNVSQRIETNLITQVLLGCWQRGLFAALREWKGI